MKAIREDVLHRAFTDMWNKLYTNQGTILEPLLKELTELVAARQDSEEIRQLDKEIKDISEQSQILNQVMRKGYMDSALFMESSNKLGWQLTECRRKKTLPGDSAQLFLCITFLHRRFPCTDRTAYPTDRRTGRINGGV